MELFLIELMLWAGLIFFLWIMKNQLSQIEAEIEKIGFLRAPLTVRAKARYDHADSVFDEIGRYRDCPIHQVALIGGKVYRFDHICAEGAASNLRQDQRCLSPGLVYYLSSEGLAAVIVR